MALMDSAPQMLGTDNSVALAHIGPVCAAIWRNDVTPESFAKQRAALADAVQKFPGKAAFLCVIEPTSKPPSDELRKASVAMLDEHGDKLKRVALVIEGTGFRASLVRTVLSGLALTFSRRANMSYFADVTHGGLWMAGPIGIPSVTQLVLAVEEVRATLPKTK